MEVTENIPNSELDRGAERLLPEQRALTRAREGLCRYINPDKDLTPEERPIFDKMFELAESRALQAEREAQERDPIEFICQSLTRIAEKDEITTEERLLLQAKAAEWKDVQEKLQLKWDSLKVSENTGGNAATPVRLYEAFVSTSGRVAPQIDLTTGDVIKGGKKVYVEGTKKLAISILNELGFLNPNEDISQRGERAVKYGSGEAVHRDTNGNITYLELNSSKIGKGILGVVYTPGLSYRPQTRGQNTIDVRLSYGTLTGPDYRTPVANAMIRSIR